MRAPDGRLAHPLTSQRPPGPGARTRTDRRLALGLAAAVLAVSGPAVLLGAPAWVVVVPMAIGLAAAVALRFGGLQGMRVGRVVRQAVLDDVDGRVITGPNGEVLFTNDAFRVLAGGGSLATAVGGDEESVRA